ncbi:MAG: EAL domain-containing protein [Candidatus Competibacteraceae bacterium]|nr:EAL domain-containing protein [Candidatus Competibacteraceae bacterium]
MTNGDRAYLVELAADRQTRILVVDDDPLTRMLVDHTLTPEGFNVEQVGSGELALFSFAGCPFDLILLDVVMPGLDGFDTCARLRQLPAGTHVPIVMITALDDEPSMEQAYGAGATDFITKPLSSVMLIHRIRYILRASAAMRELTWRVDFQRVLIETIPVPILVEDDKEQCLVSNPAFDTLTGRTQIETAGDLERTGYWIPKPAYALDAERSFRPWRQRIYETEMVGADGETKSVVVHQAMFTQPAKSQAGVISVVLDITERKKYEENLRLFETVFQTAADAIMVTDAEGVIKSVNPAFAAITGYSAAEAIGQTPRILNSGRHDDRFYATLWHSLRESGQWSGELWQRRKNGEIYPVWENVAAVRSADRRIVEYVAFFNDITARKRTEQETFYRANYDPLTGLPNRNLLRERLEQALKQARRYDRKVALMFADLDRFKQVNDMMGHSWGDRLLCQTASRLGACVREADTVARQGGDEFVVVLPNIAEEHDAWVVAEKIVGCLAEPFDLGGDSVRIGASIGISLYPTHGENYEELVRHADLAMYQAKLAGRNTYRVYEPAMSDEQTRQLRLETDLRFALERGELAVHFQPILEVASGRLAGAEALLRWRHPERGMVPPSEFVQLAEEKGLIREIGAWVLERSCQTLERWRGLGLDIPLSVNLSSAQILRGLSVETLRALFERYHLRPQQLIFEVAEDILLADGSQTRQWLDDMRELGIRLNLDDFGTGYSSLSCLKQYAIHRVKIDLSFVRDMVVNADDRVWVEAILALSRVLGIAVVAEGVETREQFDLLRGLGCDYAQGFYFSPPVTAEEFVAVARRSGALPE